MILEWLKLFGGLETTSQSPLANLQQVHDFTTASRTQTCQQRKVAIICGTSSAKAAKFPAYRSIPGGRGAFFGWDGLLMEWPKWIRIMEFIYRIHTYMYVLSSKSIGTKEFKTWRCGGYMGQNRNPRPGKDLLPCKVNCSWVPVQIVRILSTFFNIFHLS